MDGRTDSGIPDRREISRRAWLAAAAAGFWTASGRSDEPAPSAGEATERLAIERRARLAKLGPLRSSATEHYLGLGDAPDDFRDRALQICEALANDLLVHLRFKGFAVERPAQPLAIVTLAGPESYAAFAGEPAETGVGGHYDLDTNHLVLFDNRSPGPTGFDLAGKANLVALAHEATHQLTFNIGLLDRSADVPLAVSEGWATYAEVRRPTGSTRPGQPNRGRLAGLVVAQQADEPWIPVSRLLTDDTLFQGDGTRAATQLAYAEGWLLTYALMQPAQPEALRDYLAALRERRDPSHRLDDARAHLGDLDRLDRSLRKLAGQML